MLRYTWSSNINESLEENHEIKSSCKVTNKLQETESSTDLNLTDRPSLASQKQESKDTHIRTVDTSQVIPVVDIT